MTSETVPWMLSRVDGAYYGKILIYAPISRYRRGLLRQNSFLRHDIPLLTGLITAKFLSAPRYPGIDGAYYGKILICAPISRYRRGLLRQNSLSVPRCTKVEGIIDLVQSHIPASVKVGGYNRPDFISHTRVHEDRWV